MHLVVYGVFHTKIADKRPKDIICFNCESKGEMSVNRYANVFSLFFLPMFPFKIYNEVDCIKCKNSLLYSEMDAEWKNYYSQFKIRKTPIWLFSGVILIFLLVGWVLYKKSMKIDEYKTRLENSPIERVLDIETRDNNYTSLKICAVKDTSFQVVYNSYEVSSYSEIDQILFDEYYKKDTVSISRKAVLEMIEEEKIKSVHW